MASGSVGLVPQSRPPITDIPVPVGFEMAESISRDYESSGSRYIDHTYEGYADKIDADRFYAAQMPSKAWTEVLGDVIERMAKSGMRAAYLDSFNHGGTYLNCNPTECKTCWGGGNQYIKDNQRMFETIKQRVRKIDPEFCFTGESLWEGNIGQLDAFLAVNTTYQYLNGDQVTAIPLVQAVYHDYTQFYGLWVNGDDLSDGDGRGYFAKFGQAFVWGVKSGWDQPKFLTTFKTHEKAAEEYEQRLAAYHAAKELLVYGTMLRQPPIFGDLPKIKNIHWYRAWSKDYFNVALPAVLHEAW